MNIWREVWWRRWRKLRLLESKGFGVISLEFWQVCNLCVCKLWEGEGCIYRRKLGLGILVINQNNNIISDVKVWDEYKIHWISQSDVMVWWKIKSIGFYKDIHGLYIYFWQALENVYKCRNGEMASLWEMDRKERNLW